ncbi:TlyA family rRNA (cytidine-2'-O)-methyltransferase [Aquifex aeolicus]|uniref:Hemolysin n=1 Tax=Aquifex aeolicus (strain VF5) TaxID=224324 RepID=O66971_AQUAE|nr:TlyA family rRNA (cytidine-2'-O)-methyltransferase [Aquifex aeolicus]AAC06935.1 hemolysin [Aquifex aeolicus VF5]
MRLDKYLTDKGIVPSREKAQAVIMAGQVLVNGKVVDKPGYRLKGNEKVEVKELPKYVSRGGEKLEWAIKRFSLDLKDKVVLDVGSSTGGFTDCALQHGAKKVYAVDVGRGQMDYKLRQDPRVVLYEETDARELSEEHVPEKVDLITCDVSFISSTKVLPNVFKFLKEDGLLLVLVKPQFELCPRKVKKGVVREKEHKREALQKVVNFLKENGFRILGVIKSKPKGTKGNEEFFVLAGRKGEEVNLSEAIEKALEEVVD